MKLGTFCFDFFVYFLRISFVEDKNSESNAVETTVLCQDSNHAIEASWE